MTDEEILSLYRQRDEAAIRQTDISYGRLLRNLSFHILSDQSDAQSCVNDTYITAWNRIPPEFPQYFCAWLSRITRNLSISLLRRNTADKRGGSVRPASFSELENILSGTPTPEEEFNAQQLGQDISDFLNTQSEKTRILFVHRYFYCETIEKATRHAGMRTASAKTALYRVRENLRSYLNGKGYDL